MEWIWKGSSSPACGVSSGSCSSSHISSPSPYETTSPWAMKDCHCTALWKQPRRRTYTTSCRRCLSATTRHSPTAARRCQADSGNAWHWPVRWCAAPPSCSLMRPPVISTPSPSARCSKSWSGCTPRGSSSLTGSPRSCVRTRSWSWRTARSSSRDVTTSSSRARDATPSSCAPSCPALRLRGWRRHPLGIGLRAVPRRTGATDRRVRSVSVGIAATTGDGGEHVIAELDDRRGTLRHPRALVVRQRRVVLTVPPCTNHISLLPVVLSFPPPCACTHEEEVAGLTTSRRSLHRAVKSRLDGEQTGEEVRTSEPRQFKAGAG